MLNPMAETYLGDNTLKSLLEEIGSSFSVFEVKAIILGAINNVGYVPPAKVIESIVGNPQEEEAISFKDQDQAMRFYGQIFACWNSMNEMKEAPIIFSPIPKDASGEVLLGVIEARCDELTSFLTFLDAAEYLEDFTDEKAIDAFCELGDHEAGLYELLERATEEQEKFHDEALSFLSELQGLWEYAFPLIKKQLAFIRMQSMASSPRQSMNVGLDLNQPSKNSPCSCGSGKKFKRCCGLGS